MHIPECHSWCITKFYWWARLDIAGNGFWGGRHETTSLDVRIFNAYADSNKTTSLTSTYLKHENEKRRMHELQVHEVEYASFTSLVMSATGGMAKQATVFYNHLASLLQTRGKHPTVPLWWTGSDIPWRSFCYALQLNAFEGLVLLTITQTGVLRKILSLLNLILLKLCRYVMFFLSVL